MSCSDLIRHEDGDGWFAWVDMDGREYEFYFPHTLNFSFNEIMGFPYGGLMDAFKWRAYRQQMDVQKKTCTAFVDNYNRFRERGVGLYIFSDTSGSGKTFLACCIVNEIMKRYNTPARFISSADYLELERRFEPTDKYRNTTLLVLDDIGAQADKTEFQREAIFRLIDHRYKDRLPTIYTSNLSFMGHKDNDRVFSRIYERSIAVKMPEESIREKKADRMRSEFLASIGLSAEGRLK